MRIILYSIFRWRKGSIAKQTRGKVSHWGAYPRAVGLSPEPEPPLGNSGQAVALDEVLRELADKARKLLRVIRGRTHPEAEEVSILGLDKRVRDIVEHHEEVLKPHPVDKAVESHVDPGPIVQECAVRVPSDHLKVEFGRVRVVGGVVRRDPAQQPGRRQSVGPRTWRGRAGGGLEGWARAQGSGWVSVLVPHHR